MAADEGSKGALALLVVGGLGAAALVGFILLDTPGAPPAAPQQGGAVAGKTAARGVPLDRHAAIERAAVAPPAADDELRDADGGAVRRKALPLASVARLNAAAQAYRAANPAQTAEPQRERGPDDITEMPDRTPTPRANLSPDDIRDAVKAVMPSLQNCYESGLKMNADSAGKATIKFTLVAADGGGFVQDAEIESGLGNPVTDACLLDQLAKANFPMPRGDGKVRVTYPFQFAR
jgi:hypothetical protein